VSQQARNLCWELAEIGVDARFLIHDHDSKYGGGSDLVFRAEGMEVIRTPIAAPEANAHMERRSVRLDANVNRKVQGSSPCPGANFDVHGSGSE
jgi:hypothetical protein